MSVLELMLSSPDLFSRFVLSMANKELQVVLTLCKLSVELLVLAEDQKTANNTAQNALIIRPPRPPSPVGYVPTIPGYSPTSPGYEEWYVVTSGEESEGEEAA